MIERRTTLRCAIYTRKSSEEGLQQSFNSLDAQREACQAYILSQRQESWRAIPTYYDDGGYSGGNMVRPALKQLMADIGTGKVDIVVVYKVDRLTRSLADFAKIIEAFDAKGVSFVSVTQQFNTTSSMGRLTLNVLLSFAQFEREVTGERIRDKIAASKRRGMWMGGPTPLGYDLLDRKLIISREEAEQVREIFRRYLEFGCVRKLKLHLDEQGVRSKERTSRNGNRSGGAAFARGALYRILKNRIYLGEITHRKHSYPGEHEAIIDQELWDDVHTKLADNARDRRSGSNCKDPSPLRGILFDSEGTPFTPSHSVKDGKRYRYYVCRSTQEDGSNLAMRLPAKDLEDLILAKLRDFLRSSDQILQELSSCEDPPSKAHDLIRAAAGRAQKLDGTAGMLSLRLLLDDTCARIVISRQTVQLRVSKQGLLAWLSGRGKENEAGHEGCGSGQEQVVIETAASLERCRGEMQLIVPGSLSRRRKPVPSLIKAVSRAHDWVMRIESGEFQNQRAIAQTFGLDERYVSRILPLAFLAPNRVEAILDGNEPPTLTLDALTEEVKLGWEQQ